jgi:hypothetical protein
MEPWTCDATVVSKKYQDPLSRFVELVQRAPQLQPQHSFPGGGNANCKMQNAMSEALALNCTRNVALLLSEFCIVKRLFDTL